MNIALGRRRLVISFIVDQVDPVGHRFPVADAASDRELASLEAERMARFDRTRWTSNAALYGVGYPR
ncbi:MAG: hypothetical protein AB7G88_02295 [Thermomicrobiales bacterium]